MAYKIVNGRVVSTSKKQKLGGAALGFQVDNDQRKIYMVRMRVDQHGRCHEENRTTYHQPGWLDFTEQQWVEFRDERLATMNAIVRQSGNLHHFGGDHKNSVTINVY